MEGVGWDDGEEDLTRFLREEHPRVAALPVNVRYRTFAPAALDSTVRAARSAHDFYLHRRRRLDASVEAELAASGAPVVQTLQSVLTDSFAIAQRQQETYQWLAQRRSAEEILHRFAVDRKLNAAPCLAAVNRALSVLGREGGADAVLDVLEDVLLDSAVIPLSTLLEAVKALPGQPVRAARVALSFKDSLGSQRVPASVWGNLAVALAHAATQMAKPLEDHFMDLYERVLAMVRASTGRLSDALVISFGRCLLTSHKPIAAAVRLVKEELLAVRGREALASAPLQLGAFLSDLLVQLCRQEERGGSQRARHTSSVADALVFATDVVRYAYATRLQLVPKVFDAVLALCDARHDYGRLCVLFAAMCVLSTPTLASTLRALEVNVQLADVRGALQRLLHVSSTNFFLWCLQRFPGVYELSGAAEGQRRAALRVFSLLGVLAVEENQSARLPAYFNMLTHDTAVPPSLAACGVAAAVRHCREQSSPPPNSVLAVLRGEHEALVRAVLQSTAPCPPPPSSPSASPSLPSVDAELQRLLTSEAVYCTVLSATALATLAAREAAEQAFVRMMDSYRRKCGAVAVVPFECVCPSFGLPERATAMLRRWHGGHEWCAILPLAVSLQLDGSSACDVCCAAVTAVKRRHGKVMFIGGTEEEVAAAKARSAEPAVVMETLVRRLSP